MFKEPRALNSVAKFHRTFLHPIEKQPIIPSKDRIKLRIILLEEELDELRKAIKKNKIDLVADALCDIQYVLSGAVLEFGLGHHFKQLFDEIQRSNLTKICRTKKEAIDTINYYKKKEKGEDFVYKKTNGKYIVYRLSDNKVMKSINYSKARLSELLDNCKL